MRARLFRRARTAWGTGKEEPAEEVRPLEAFLPNTFMKGVLVGLALATTLSCARPAGLRAIASAAATATAAAVLRSPSMFLDRSRYQLDRTSGAKGAREGVDAILPCAAAPVGGMHGAKGTGAWEAVRWCLPV